MNPTTKVGTTTRQGNSDAQTAAYANQLVWRVSLVLFCGMALVLLVLWNRSVTLAVLGGTGSLWLLTTGFIHYFFRDPTPDVPQAPDVIVSPAHGLVDVVDQTSNLEFMGGPCRRVSIFLSVFDVHVQYAPVAGRVVLSRHQPGRFLNALSAHSAEHNENHLVGIQFCDASDGRLAVRQIAGCIARRIRTWVLEGDSVRRGSRLGLIQFGSRCDLYLPLSVQITIQPGNRVVGGETVVAMHSKANLSDGRTLPPRTEARLMPR
jgi:phosphatidylserine decarboxylase